MGDTNLAGHMDAALSDESFRNQFDPNSKDHHGGDTTVIQTGSVNGAFGAGKTPAGLAEFAETPAIAEPDTYGEEYEKLMKERKDLNEMKTAINKVNRSIGVMLTDMTNQDYKAEKEKAVKDLEAYKVKFDQKSEWPGEIDTIITEASSSSQDLKKNINSMATGTTRKIGFAQKKGLARIKEIKKEWKASNKD